MDSVTTKLKKIKRNSSSKNEKIILINNNENDSNTKITKQNENIDNNNHNDKIINNNDTSNNNNSKDDNDKLPSKHENNKVEQDTKLNNSILKKQDSRKTVKEKRENNKKPKKKDTTNTPQTTSNNDFFIIYIVLAVVVLTLSIGAAYKINEYFTTEPSPIADYMPAIKSINVTPQQIQNKQYMEENFDFYQTSYSMQHYMNAKNYDGICAIDIGIPLSYCFFRTYSGDLLTMFNLNITGFSEEAILHQERSHFCEAKGNILVERRQEVWATYHSENGRKLEKRFVDKDSYIIQHLVDINDAISICSNTHNQNQVNQIIIVNK